MTELEYDEPHDLPSTRLMALACEMDEKTVLSALEELIERGMLVLETREGLSPKYILTSPSSWKGKGR